MYVLCTLVLYEIGYNVMNNKEDLVCSPCYPVMTNKYTVGESCSCPTTNILCKCRVIKGISGISFKQIINPLYNVF